METYWAQMRRRVAQRTWEHWRQLLFFPCITAATTLGLLWLFREPIGAHVIAGIALTLLAAVIVVVVVIFVNIVLVGQDMYAGVLAERDKALASLADHQDERRIPKNRDALVTCIKRLEHAVAAAISEYRVREMIKEESYGADSVFDYSKLQAVKLAREELDVQIGIAGQDFHRPLEHFALTADAPLDDYRAADGQPLGQAACAAAEKKVRDATGDLLRRLDAGQLYFPRIEKA